MAKIYLDTEMPTNQVEEPKAEESIIPDNKCGPDMSGRSQRYWEQKGWEYKSKELENARAAAGKWKTTITSLAGVTAIVTVITGREAITKLDHQERVLAFTREGWANALLVAALAAVVLAIMRASRAELGPMREFVGSPDAVCNYTNQEPADATDAIKQSQLLTLASVALLLTAIYLIGYGKRDVVAQNYLALPATGSAVCGTLQTNPDGSVFLVSGSATAGPLADGVELQAVASCGATN